MSDVASEYGKALFDLACEAGAEEQILSETRTLYGVFSRSGDYMRFLSYRRRSVRVPCVNSLTAERTNTSLLSCNC